MLGQRVITAVVLVLALLLALAAPQAWPFALLTLVLIAAAGWEWGRLNQAGAALSIAIGAALAIAGVLAMAGGWTQQSPAPGWWLVALPWVVGGGVALRAGPAAWPSLPRPVRWILGGVVLAAAWLALAQARAVGVNFLLSVLALVWSADIAAYFGGRAFGRRKLAPSISPGKSWAGVWAGVAGVLVVALLWAVLDRTVGFDSDSLATRLHRQIGVVGAALALAALAGLSVVGDLFESLVKRAAGAKDSSRLLPGHGGVLDRVDALLPVLPAALALSTLGAG